MSIETRFVLLYYFFSLSPFPFSHLSIMAKEVKHDEVRRSETNEGGVHTVREERTTVVKPKGKSAPAAIPAVNKSQLTYLVPIALAVILAIALLSMRGGKIRSEPRTWQDSVTDVISDVQSRVESVFGFDTTSQVKSKANDAAAKAKAKAQAAAKQGKPYADAAADTIKDKLADTYDAAADKANDAIEALKDKVGIHTTDEAKAAAAKASAKAKKQAGDAADKAKAKANEHYETAKEKAADLKDQAHGKAKDYVKDQRSYATQAADYIHDKVDEGGRWSQV